MKSMNQEEDESRNVRTKPSSCFDVETTPAKHATQNDF